MILMNLKKKVLEEEFQLLKEKKVKPLKILEIGTANGYSGCILGSLGGKLITIELDEKIANEARLNFKKFGIDAKVIIGDGVVEVEKLCSVENLESFDLIFIDFSKKDYITVLENCIKLLKIGGVIITDNINFEKCSNYKNKILNHSKLKTKIIDLGDGMAYSTKFH